MKQYLKKGNYLLKVGDYLYCKKDYTTLGNNIVDYLYYSGKKYIIKTIYQDDSISIESDHKINHITNNGFQF